MGDPAQSSNNFGNSRSRWAPKPEQIMILESIFNGSLVNPSKDETKGIRKVLEKYGPVVDTNVFYWFQNRRSRFRRQRRQNRESEIARGGAQPQQQAEVAPAIQRDTNLSVGFWPGPVSCGVDTGSSSSSSYAVDHGISDTWTNNIINNNNININTYDHDYNLWCSGAPAEMIQQEYNQNPMFFPTDYSDQLNYNPEMITVFINGVATEVKKERLHLRSMFGGDFLMYGSSSLPLQVDCNGFLVQCLEHGEHYYLVAT